MCVFVFLKDVWIGGGSWYSQKTFLGGKLLAWWFSLSQAICSEILLNGSSRQLHRFPHWLWWDFSLVPCPLGKLGVFVHLITKTYSLIFPRVYSFAINDICKEGSVLYFFSGSCHFKYLQKHYDFLFLIPSNGGAMNS